MRLAFTQVALGQKVPMNKGWNLKENAIYDRAELNGGNVAVLLAYCEPVPLCCLDIDDLEKAKPILQSMDIDPETYDAVRSRSGRPNSLKIFFKLTGGCEPLPTQVIRAKNHVIFELRCATTKGKTVCDVIPPSRHPGGTTYEWDDERELTDVTVIPQKLFYYWVGIINAEKQKNQDLAISSFKPPIFWKDKEIIKQQLKFLTLKDINSLIKRVNKLELLIKQNINISEKLTNNFILETINS